MENKHLRGYKVLIYPDQEQIKEIEQNINISRAVYNLGLNIQNEAYQNQDKHFSYFTMTKIFTDMRNSKEYEWLKTVPLSTIRTSLQSLDDAFERFFSKKCRYPKFKSRKRSKKSFGLRSDRTHISGKYIRVSGFKHDMILAKNHIVPSNRRLYDTRISFDGYNYWFTCMTEVDYKIPDNTTNPIGIDVGIRNMITTSDGEFYRYSDTFKLQKKLKRSQKRLSKDYLTYLNESLRTKTKYEDISKSQNHYKRLRKQRKIYDKIRNKKRNDIHTATKRIVEKNPSVIVIEDISVREMLKDPWMKKYSPQFCFYEIHRQIQYKAEDRGIPVIKADRNFPSTQKCNKCGFIHDLHGNHIFKCPVCGYTIDRDLNAAYNLRDLAYL